MPQRLSRRKLAEYAGAKLLDGVAPVKALKEVAAYLVETRRTSELELVVRDIEDVLAARGVVVAEVTSARPLSKTIKAEITEMVGAKKVHFRETVDESVLGGVRVDTPGKRYDGTIRRKLMALKAKQL